jgi:hypothetical protein
MKKKRATCTKAFMYSPLQIAPTPGIKPNPKAIPGLQRLELTGISLKLFRLTTH